jgi:thiosulfate/3-mercaptopyruvate sulfurtransferase
MEDIIMKKCMIALLITIFLNGVCFAATDAGLIVDTAYVKDKTGKPGWVIIDASFPDDYKEGHIPGAILLPPMFSKAYAEDTKRSEVLHSRVEKTLGDMGISSDSHVIICGDPANTHWNAVMFWVLEAQGCNSSLSKCTVQYYDGGVQRWQQEGGKIEQNETKPSPTTFKAIIGTKRRATINEMINVLTDIKKANIIDVRTEGEYVGTDIRALRGGHIPGAINIDYAKNFDTKTYRMHPLSDLDLLYRGVPEDSRIITYCQTGQRASYTYLVLRALGYKNVAIYDDGWRVYGSNLPLAAEDETWFDFTKVNNVLQAVKDLGKNAHK